ncbi:LysR family transcriptional regulator [Desulfuromonas versatilis]|uniref:LysR family transcriptional regulator n=1 Tax=Desulfuromonas versatilis TaxID=2802975 RepID=A0ABM8HUJ6_9BACT|nr:selenium metabolism-associated LysR family transcriptional regulator [Desulfuromonas versatilis]BCR06004.1 LysR family transcriptional regulator [Desulfuromonas versatilis]
MDIRRLEVFCAVVELKSFTKGAESVCLSQPSVSEHIRILEEMLGDKLLDRLGREVLPTVAGQILYQYARRIIRLRDEAIQAIENQKGNLSGQLVVGASTIPGTYILPRLVHDFRNRHPEIRVTLKIASTSQVAEGILQGEIELGVIGARWKDNLLQCSEMFSDELVLTVYPEHPWAGRQSVELDELPSQPFILRERGSGTRQVMADALKEAGFDIAALDAIAEMGTTEAVRQGVKSRLGISILSARAVQEDVERGALQTLPVAGLNLSRPFYLATRRNRQATPLAQAFLEFLGGGGGR